MLRETLLAMSRSKRLKSFVSESSLAWRAASRFVAGNTISEALDVVGNLNAEGMLATLDHLGENVSRREEAERGRDAYVEALSHIHARGAKSGISLKLTALGLDLGTDVAKALLTEVVSVAAAYDPKIFVRIDMEGSDYTQQTLDIFYDVFPDFNNLGIVLQSYLYRTDDDVERAIDSGATVRLVKGAYLEPESIAYPNKEDVDRAFLRQAARLLSDEAREAGVFAAIATHDSDIIDWAKAYAEERGIPKEKYEFQMLHGIRRDLQTTLVADGYRVRVYVPYGTEWYPYFMRRLAERPENVMFLLRNVTDEVRS